MEAEGGSCPIQEADLRQIAESFVYRYGLASHLIEGFEDFLHEMLEQIIKEHSPTRVVCSDQGVMHEVSFHDISLRKATVQESNWFIRCLVPEEARIRKQTYCFYVIMNVHHRVFASSHQEGGEERFDRLIDFTVYKDLQLCEIPAMLNTSACRTHKNPEYLHRDEGTFIVNGYDKVMITQERLRSNFPYISKTKSPYAKIAYTCQVRSRHPGKIRSTSTLYIHVSTHKAMSVPDISVKIPFVTHAVPIVVVFRLLGVETVEQMVQLVMGSSVSSPLRDRIHTILMADASDTKTKSREDLYDWIGAKSSDESKREKRIMFIRHVFTNEFLPHCVVDGDQTNVAETHKSIYLGYCVRKLVLASMGLIPPDNIDDYSYTRCETAGVQFALLFRQLLRSFIKSLKTQLFLNVQQNKVINIADLFKDRKISNGFRYACSTGNWGIQRGSISNQTGVCQILYGTNNSAKLSHLRCINMPLNRDGKVAKPRQIDPSSYGLLCSAETPEGRSVGLLKHLAFFTRIRVGNPNFFIEDVLRRDMGVLPIALENAHGLTMVLVNGVMCGGVADPLSLVNMYRKYRRHMSVPVDSGIAHFPDQKLVSILSDPGECYRPLMRVDEMHRVHALCQTFRTYPEYLWTELLLAGVVEFINKEEESTLFVASSVGDVKPQHHTHVEIHALFTLFGTAAAEIPFSNHNQAPRNIYQCLGIHMPVKMADGRWVPIGEVKIGDSIITFDPLTLDLSVTKVIHHMTTQTTKPVVIIKTYTGAQIVATTDHLFMTNRGWLCARDFTSDVLLVLLGMDKRPLFVGILDVLLSEETLVADLTTESPNHSFICGHGGFFLHNSAMGKQAISTTPLDFATRLDTKSFTLDYPQRPLVSTWGSDLVGSDDLPSGQACVVAICSFTGRNQEDSVILSQAAIDRGLFRSHFFNVIRDSEVSYGADAVRFTSSTEAVGGLRVGNRSKISAKTGLIKIGSVVEKGDVLIGKVVECTTTHVIESGQNKVTATKREKRDQSILYTRSEKSRAESVFTSTNKEGMTAVCIRLSEARSTEIGDKLSSRHGQKGICGAIMSPEDMPQTLDGVIPDILINPHAIPSRMTVGQLLEMLLGKLACIEGRIGDGTPFRNVSVEEIEERMPEAGKGFGSERMMNGKTGELLQGKVFVGVAHYQALRHMVRDKIHARSRGPNQVLTRQPQEGRSRSGGLRLGEMERDALISHGASLVIDDRFLHSSDGFDTYVCNQCGGLAEHNSTTTGHFVSVIHRTPYCRLCRSNENIHPVKVPYAFLLLARELEAVHVRLRFSLDVK